MKIIKLPPTVVNGLLHIWQQLIASGFAALKCSSNCDFTRFGRNIKINRNLFWILRNFTETSIKIHIDDVKSFVTFRISLDFFYFFDRNAQNRNWKNKKKSTLIRNVMKLCTSSICIFIELSIKFRSILTNPQFILNFLLKRIKLQYFSNCASGKVI